MKTRPRTHRGRFSMPSGAITTNGWQVARALCRDCLHSWVAVYKLGTNRLECPSCNSLNTQVKVVASKHFVR